MGPDLFGVGPLEALVVLVVALIAIGPKRFPEIARQGGRWYRTARRFTAEITADVREAINEIEQEVESEAEGLRDIRELGEEVEGGLREAGTDIDRAGREAVEAAEEPAALEAPAAPTRAPPEQTLVGADGTLIRGQPASTAPSAIPSDPAQAATAEQSAARPSSPDA